MSLYDGVGIDSSEVGGKDKDVSGWSSSLKLLQSHSQLKAKKASVGPSRKRNTLAPVVDLKRGTGSRDNGSEVYFNQLTGQLERGSPSMLSLSVGAVRSPFIPSEPSLTGLSDEYDPLRPNEYDDFIKKRKEQRQREREDERKRDLEEREKRRKERHRNQSQQDDGRDHGGEFERRRRRHEQEEEEEDYERPRRSGGAAIAPPMSLMEEDQAVQPLDSESGASGENGFKPPEFNMTSTPGASFGLGGSVASKIMAKYGYKEGQGLGKKEQGMSIALQVEKTSKRGGKIIHEKDLPKGILVNPDPPRAEQMTNANLLRNLSKVILLRNMVGPGEVDEDLEAETAEECLKYGKVVKCIIFEIPDTTDDEAVRIFVEFERQEAAIKAVVDLNGRYFGGRIVKGGFYNLDKFRRLDLADEVD